MKQKVLSGLAMLALVMVALLLPAPASAAPGGVAMWKVNAGSTLAGVMAGGNTSIETTDAFPAQKVTRGTVLDLDYTLGDGATCIGGAPRVFATVGGQTVNSWDQGIGTSVEKACEGTVLLPAGELTAIGVVWDNGQTGTITVTSLTLNGKSLSFNEKTDLTEVTALVPTATKPTCDKAGSVTVPKPGEGYTYATKRNVTDGVTVSATVTAKAEDGYKLTGPTTWTFPVAKLTGKACEEQPPAPIVVVPEKPVVVKVTCDDLTWAAETKGVTYTVGDYGNGWFMVHAKADKGYVIKEGAATEWKLTYEEPNCTSTPKPGDTTAPGTGTPTTPGSGGNVGSGTDGGSTDGSLPKTGVKVLGMAGVGGLMVAVGGITLVLLRRRRDQGSGAHREDGDTQVMPAV